MDHAAEWAQAVTSTPSRDGPARLDVAGHCAASASASERIDSLQQDRPSHKAAVVDGNQQVGWVLTGNLPAQTAPHRA